MAVVVKMLLMDLLLPWAAGMFLAVCVIVGKGSGE